MAQMRDGVAAIRAAVDINVAASLGMLSQEQVDELAEMGVHRYNHNLETARSYFPSVVTTHTWEERWDTLTMVRDAGMEVCCGGIVGMGETLPQRRSSRRSAPSSAPDEVPLTSSTPAGNAVRRPARDLDGGGAADDSPFRLRSPAPSCGTPAFGRSRSATRGPDGLLGGVNAVIVGNYLTTLGRGRRRMTCAARRTAHADQGAVGERCDVA